VYLNFIRDLQADLLQRAPQQMRGDDSDDNDEEGGVSQTNENEDEDLAGVCHHCDCLLLVPYLIPLM
jgi:hypothetical protein